jgi:hypothetical protein
VLSSPFVASNELHLFWTAELVHNYGFLSLPTTVSCICKLRRQPLCLKYGETFFPINHIKESTKPASCFLLLNLCCSSTCFILSDFTFQALQLNIRFFWSTHLHVMKLNVAIPLALIASSGVVLAIPSPNVLPPVSAHSCCECSFPLARDKPLSISQNHIFDANTTY